MSATIAYSLYILAFYPGAAGMSLSTGAAVVLSVTVAFCAKRILDLNEKIQLLEGETRRFRKQREAVSNTPIRAEIVAAITAAVLASCGGNARVVNVRPVPEKSGSWSLEGRRSIFHSHKVR